MKIYERLAWLVLCISVTCVLGAQRPPQQCTAIKVPVSINLPVWANGTQVSPPTHVSPAFKTIMNTVELPAGFTAVGGGDGVVIACN